MTERVLCGPLIDFGKSIWNSPLLREEFPGLQSKNIRPIGKFGIGFFSVFEIAKPIQVTSKHYEAGMSEAKVLEFRSLATRPLLRPAEAKELPRVFSTRVSLKIDDKARVFGPYKREPNTYVSLYDLRYRAFQNLSFETALLRLIIMLDVQVEYMNRIDGTGFVHTSNIYEVDAAEFLEELLSNLPQKERTAVKLTHAAQMRPLEGTDGSKYGRAALSMLDSREPSAGSISVGGFVFSNGRGPRVPFVGVIEGCTDQAARQLAYSTVPADVIERWVTNQARLIDQKKFLKAQLLRASRRIIAAGGDPCSLPYCFMEGSLIDFATAKLAMKTSSQILIPLDRDRKIYSYSDMNATYFDHQMKKEVFILGRDEYESSIFDYDTFSLIEKEGHREISVSDLKLEIGGSLYVFLDTLRKLWGCEPRLTVREEQLLQADLHSLPPLRWVIDLRRPS